MHRGNKISFLVVLFFLQIGDTLLTSHTTRLVARVPLVMIGCSTVAGISRGLKGNNSKPCVFCYILRSGLQLPTDVEKNVYLDSY